MSAEYRTILVVDDDQAFRERLARAFEDRGLVTMIAGDLEGAVFAANARTPELAVVDLQLIGGSGLDVVAQLREIRSDMRIVLLTGLADRSATLEALQRGAVACLMKPADADQILGALVGPGSPTGG